MYNPTHTHTCACAHTHTHAEGSTKVERDEKFLWLSEEECLKTKESHCTWLPKNTVSYKAVGQKWGMTD